MINLAVSIPFPPKSCYQGQSWCSPAAELHDHLSFSVSCCNQEKHDSELLVFLQRWVIVLTWCDLAVVYQNLEVPRTCQEPYVVLLTILFLQ